MSTDTLHAKIKSEPMCCDEPMVHNTFTEEYECADAYFRLADEGWDELGLVYVTADDVGPELAPFLTHWRASRIPDDLAESLGIDTGGQP